MFLEGEGHRLSRGTDVVQSTPRNASRGHFSSLATHLAGLSLERTTGFEPTTLTLARLFGTTLPPATSYIHQCFTGLLTYRSRP